MTLQPDFKIDLTLANCTDAKSLRELCIQTFTETFASTNTEENMRQYISEAYDEETLRIELKNPLSYVYFAKANDCPVGYIKVNFGNAQTEIRDPRGCEIQRIYVLKPFHGRNVAQKLMEQAIALARTKHVTYLWLGVFELNARAVAFYSKYGFVAFDKHVFKLGDDEQTDIMMKLTLEENNAGANISMTSDRSADPVSEEICVTNQSSSDAQSDPSGT